MRFEVFIADMPPRLHENRQRLGDHQRTARNRRRKHRGDIGKMSVLYRRGHSGDPIERIQKRLAGLGLDPGPVDGIFGPLTLEAVRQFQMQQSIPVDGVVGPETWQRLFGQRPYSPVKTPELMTGVPSVFICYRREDSADVVGRIYDRLLERFGKDSVFKDVDSIPLGVDFREHLRDSIARFRVILVVIGPKWLSLEGGQRLRQERDYVRIEIESGLKLGLPLIPLLVYGAAMPAEENLPVSIAQLAYQNGLSIRPDPDFRHDMTQLIDGIQSLLERPGTERTCPEDGTGKS